MNSESGGGKPDVATAGNPPSLPPAVATLIVATNKTIASAFQHGRRAVRLRDVLIARVLFAIARRLARLAWRVAQAGKRRMT